MFYALVSLKYFKCHVDSEVFMTLVQRILKDEKCLVFIQLVFLFGKP